MKITVCRYPVPHLVISSVFSEEENKKIINEAVGLRNMYKHGSVGSGTLKQEFRSNFVCEYDVIFNNNRDKSVLLSCIDNLFGNNSHFREILASFEFPMTEFLLTNYHETQVSRYGGNDQRYGWHIDRFADHSRMITFVYYFFNEPKSFEGGSIEFTNSPISNDVAVDENIDVKIIEPVNNMGLVFSSSVPHRVMPTKSSNKFEDGRFSVNCWIGFR